MDLSKFEKGREILSVHEGGVMSNQQREEQARLLAEEAQAQREYLLALETEPRGLVTKLIGKFADSAEAGSLSSVLRNQFTAVFNLGDSENGMQSQLSIAGYYVSEDEGIISGPRCSIGLRVRNTEDFSEHYLTDVLLRTPDEDVIFERVTTVGRSSRIFRGLTVPEEQLTRAAIREAAELQGIPVLPLVLPSQPIEGHAV